MTLTTLKKRAEFLRIRGGGRWSTPAFVVEALSRRPASDRPTGEQHPDTDTPAARLTAQGVAPAPRFGFTVTKKLGNAVARNRIRRRLKEAVRMTATSNADPAYDYVIIARKPARDIEFEALCREVAKALEQAPKRTGARKRPASGSAPGKGKSKPHTGATNLQTKHDEEPLPLGAKKRQTSQRTER